jgi:hypothetical protein
MARRSEVRPTSTAPHQTCRTEGQHRARSGGARPLVCTAVFGVLALATLLHVARPLQRQGAERVAGAGAPGEGAGREPWADVSNAKPAFAVQDPSLPPARYEAREQPATGDREDIAVFGSFTAPTYLSLSLTRGPTQAPSHFVALARRAARASLALERLAPPQALAAKFAPIELAEAALSQRGSAPRTCLTFRFGDADLGWGVAGWLCDGADGAATRQRLACIIDRLALDDGQTDLSLQAAFAEAQARRSPACAEPQTAGPAAAAMARAGPRPKQARPPSIRSASF